LSREIRFTECKNFSRRLATRMWRQQSRDAFSGTH